MAKEKYTAAQVIEALKKTKGMIYLAAEMLGCHHQTVYNYARRYSTVQQAINNERGKFIDVAELALARAVQAGEGWAICFALKTLGKNRGYIEKQQLEHSWQEQLPPGFEATQVQKQFAAMMAEAARQAKEAEPPDNND